MATCEIIAGPSKWDLIIVGLSCGKEVEFTFKGDNKRQVQILSVGIEDGSGESWLIIGHVAGMKDGKTTYYSFNFKGCYSTKTRKGVYEHTS